MPASLPPAARVRAEVSETIRQLRSSLCVCAQVSFFVSGFFFSFLFFLFFGGGGRRWDGGRLAPDGNTPAGRVSLVLNQFFLLALFPLLQ